MGYYFKQPIFIFVYTILFSFLGVSVSFINTRWISILTGVAINVFYIIVLFIMYYLEGKEAAKVQHSNDLQREHIIKTGDDVYLNIHKEYKAYKGFVMGAITIAPAILLFVILAIIVLATGGTTLGENYVVESVFAFLYGAFWLICSVFLPRTPLTAEKSVIAVPNYLVIGYCIPLTILVSGISYMLGARNQNKMYYIAEQVNQKIYGDKEEEGEQNSTQTAEQVVKQSFKQVSVKKKKKHKKK